MKIVGLGIMAAFTVVGAALNKDHISESGAIHTGFRDNAINP